MAKLRNRALEIGNNMRKTTIELTREKTFKASIYLNENDAKRRSSLREYELVYADKEREV